MAVDFTSPCRQVNRLISIQTHNFNVACAAFDHPVRNLRNNSVSDNLFTGASLPFSSPYYSLFSVMFYLLINLKDK